MNTSFTASSLSAPTEADIRERAYYLWLEQGCPANRDQEMWFAAKALLHDHARPPAADLRRNAEARQTDPQHQYHEPATVGDVRPLVARSGAPQRKRSRSARN